MWIEVAGAGALGGAAVFAVARGRWRAASRAAVDRLVHDAAACRASAPGAVPDLPAPVRRYFRAVLRPWQRPIAVAHLTQRGAMRVGDRDPRWCRFDATEDFDGWSPGFVWLARVRMAPGLSAKVRDAYLDGAGATRASLFGFVPLADKHDTPEIAAAALQRYLAEAPWFPTALMPGRGVQWTPIDDRSARATLSDHGTTVSIDFGFNERDEIVTARTPGRYRATKAGFALAPWSGTFGEYAERDGVRIPLQAEAAWEIDGVRRPYWRTRITGAAFATSPRK